jgi:peptide deformylase
MALLHIRLWPDPVLSQMTKVVEPDEFNTKELNGLLEDMYETMLVEDGVGLAAPQVGYSKRIAVMTDGSRRWDLINPLIEKSGFDLISKNESCLSLEGMSFKDVPRSYSIRIFYKDRTGVDHHEDFEGFLARAVQHEIDHLEGRVLVDRLLKTLSPKKRASKSKEFEDRIKAAYEAKVAKRNNPIKAEVNRQLLGSPGRTALLTAALLGSKIP